MSPKNASMRHTEERTISIDIPSGARFGASHAVVVMGTRERWSLCGTKMPSFEGVAWDEPSVVLPASHDSPDGYKLSLTSWEAVKKAAEEAIADYQALYEKDEL